MSSSGSLYSFDRMNFYDLGTDCLQTLDQGRCELTFRPPAPDVDSDEYRVVANNDNATIMRANRPIMELQRKTPDALLAIMHRFQICQAKIHPQVLTNVPKRLYRIQSVANGTPIEHTLCLFQRSITPTPSSGPTTESVLAFDNLPELQVPLTISQRVPLNARSITYALSRHILLPGFAHRFTHFTRPIGPGQSILQNSESVQVTLQTIRTEDGFDGFKVYLLRCGSHFGIVPGLISSRQMRFRLIRQQVLGIPVNIIDIINAYANEPHGEERRLFSHEIYQRSQI